MWMLVVFVLACLAYDLIGLAMVALLSRIEPVRDSDSVNVVVSALAWPVTGLWLVSMGLCGLLEGACNLLHRTGRVAWACQLIVDRLASMGIIKRQDDASSACDDDDETHACMGVGHDACDPYRCRTDSGQRQDR